MLVEKAPTDYGAGRVCAECGCKVNRYTAPQPRTGTALCNRHWTMPPGWGFGSRGLRRERVDA